MPFMKEARSKGKHAFLREDKLVIEGKEVDIHYCKNNSKTRQNEEEENTGREKEEGNLTNAEVVQQQFSTSNPVDRHADVSNLTRECRNTEIRGNGSDRR